MKRYEGLFILNTAGKEEGIQDIIDAVRNDVTAAGGKVETVQKMEKRSFARVADKQYQSGFYANIIFEAGTTIVAQLRQKFSLNPDIFRVLFTEAPVVVEAAAAAK